MQIAKCKVQKEKLLGCQAFCLLYFSLFILH